MDRPISFPDWKAALNRASLSATLKAAYTREILSFLKHCKETRSAATVATAKHYLAWREKQGRGPSREALRWFYREGRKAKESRSSETGVRDQVARMNEPAHRSRTRKTSRLRVSDGRWSRHRRRAIWARRLGSGT